VVWEELEEWAELEVWEASAELVVRVASEASASREASAVLAVPGNREASVVLEESAEPVERAGSGSTIPRTAKASGMVTPPLRRSSIAAPARTRQRAIHSEARIISAEARAQVVAVDQTSADAAVPEQEQERAPVVAVDQTLADAAVQEQEQEQARGPAPAHVTAVEVRPSATAHAGAVAPLGE